MSEALAVAAAASGSAPVVTPTTGESFGGERTKWQLAKSSAASQSTDASTTTIRNRDSVIMLDAQAFVPSLLIPVSYSQLMARLPRVLFPMS
jgi:hypothetical protein